MNESAARADIDRGDSRLRKVMRHMLFLSLLLGIFIEGYYMVLLNDEIYEKAEEARDISLQIQFLKNERDKLYGELSSIKTLAGEKRDGNTSYRQY
jgi:hypothetical protein